MLQLFCYDLWYVNSWHNDKKNNIYYESSLNHLELNKTDLIHWIYNFIIKLKPLCEINRFLDDININEELKMDSTKM